jgi:hypothetical protein
VTKILLEAGVRDVIGCDSRGALHTERADYLDGSMPQIKRWYAEMSNPDRRSGGPGDVIDGTDLFIGLSGAKVMPPEALARMNRDAMVFAMANPTPEVSPEEAEPVRADHGHGPQRLPQPDQQRAALPGHLPRSARRARPGRSRGDEARRRRRRSPRRSPRPSCARTTSSRRFQPRRRPRGERGGRRGRARDRRGVRAREHDRFAAIDAERIRAGD